MTWRDSNVTLTNQDVRLSATSPNDNVTWSIDVHRRMKSVGRDHVMTTAVERNDQTGRFYNFSSAPLILQDLHKNFINDKQKRCKNKV